MTEGDKSSQDLVWLGQLLNAAGRAAEAEDAFTEAVRLEPDVSAPWLALLAHLARHGKTEEAAARLAQMEKALPEDRLPLAVAQAREVMGQLDQAELARTAIFCRWRRATPSS